MQRGSFNGVEWEVTRKGGSTVDVVAAARHAILSAEPETPMNPRVCSAIRDTKLDTLIS